MLQASTLGARLGPRSTVVEALRVLASLGGHLKQKGPPGWLVLARGMQKLRLMEAGWVAAARDNDVINREAAGRSALLQDLLILPRVLTDGYMTFVGIALP